MQDILKEYGPAIITVVAVVALVTVVTAVIGTDGTSVVGQAFTDLIEYFFVSANSAAGL